MSCYIGTYVKHCDLCNRTKVQCRRPMGKLHPSETPEAPWDMIRVNFIVELPESHGYDAIMCVVDSLTKHAHFIPTHTTINCISTHPSIKFLSYTLVTLLALALISHSHCHQKSSIFISIHHRKPHLSPYCLSHCH
jgi:hypothetical protein